MINNAKKKRLSYNNSSKGDIIMIYGNKFMNTDNFIGLAYQENTIILNEINFKNFLKDIPKRIGKIIGLFIKAIKKLIDTIRDKKYNLLKKKVEKDIKSDAYKIFAKLKSLDPNYFIEVSDATIYKPLIDDMVQEMKSNMHNIDEFIEFSKINETDISSEENINRKKDEIEKVRKLPDMILSKGFISKYKLDSDYEFTNDGADKLVSDLKESIKKYIKKNESISNLADFKTFIEYTNTIDKAYDNMNDVLSAYYKKFSDLIGNKNTSIIGSYYEKMNEFGIELEMKNRIYSVTNHIKSGYLTFVICVSDILQYYVYILLDNMKMQSNFIYTILDQLKEDLKNYKNDISTNR